MTELQFENMSKCSGNTSAPSCGMDQRNFRSPGRHWRKMNEEGGKYQYMCTIREQRRQQQGPWEQLLPDAYYKHRMHGTHTTRGQGRFLSFSHFLLFLLLPFSWIRKVKALLLLGAFPPFISSFLPLVQQHPPHLRQTEKDRSSCDTMVQTRYQAQFSNNNNKKNSTGHNHNTRKNRSGRYTVKRTTTSSSSSRKSSRRLDKENEPEVSQDPPLLNICRSRETSADVDYSIENLVEQLDE